MTEQPQTRKTYCVNNSIMDETYAIRAPLKY